MFREIDIQFSVLNIDKEVDFTKYLLKKEIERGNQITQVQFR